MRETLGDALHPTDTARCHKDLIALATRFWRKLRLKRESTGNVDSESSQLCHKLSGPGKCLTPVPDS